MPFLLALAEDFGGRHASLSKVARRVEGRVRHIEDIIRTQTAFDSMAMARKDIDLRKALNVPVAMLQESIEKHGIKVAVDCRNTPRTIRVQESRFNQMLVNIIKNAIEAIEELQQNSASDFKPRIRIRARARKDFLVIDVIDNGIGIREERAREDFRRRLHHQGARQRPGASFGGELRARFRRNDLSAQPGKGGGTTMRVKLRLASVQPKAENFLGGGGGVDTNGVA